VAQQTGGSVRRGAHPLQLWVPEHQAAEPVAWDERLFYEDERTAKIERASLEALMTMVRSFAEGDGEIELLAIWDGDEGEPPLGTIDKTAGDLQPETWSFIERFVYRVTAART
jgi:hypothetical protein